MFRRTDGVPLARGYLLAAGVLLVALSLLGLGGCQDAASRSQDDPAPPRFQDVPDAELKQLLEEVLETNLHRTLDTSQHGAWQILHGVLAYQDRLQVMHQGKLVPALQWLLNGGSLRGFVLEPTPQGLDVVTEPGSLTGQGHEDQWLAVFSQCGLGLEQPIRWQGETYTLGDMLRRTQWDVEEGMELSWTLIALSRYLPPGTQWKNHHGETWTVERAVAWEAEQDLDSSACGGTHRLIGMTMALRAYFPDQAELDGPWAQAQQQIRRAVALARAYQQPDGAFSAQYFRRPGSTPDVKKRLGTTGHTVEFLALALEPEELAAPWMENAVRHLCQLLQETEDLAIECGALYHALHGLQVYYQRRFLGRDPSRETMWQQAGSSQPEAPRPEDATPKGRLPIVAPDVSRNSGG